MIGLNLPNAVSLTRNDRSEQDLDCFTEGDVNRARSDKRELLHR